MEKEKWEKRKLLAGIAAGIITISGMIVNAPYLVDGSPGWMNVIASVVILISWIMFAASLMAGASPLDRRKAFLTICRVIGLIMALILLLYLICRGVGGGIASLLTVFYMILMAPVSGIALPLYMGYERSVEYAGTGFVSPVLAMACYGVLLAVCGLIYLWTAKNNAK